MMEQNEIDELKRKALAFDLLAECARNLILCDDKGDKDAFCNAFIELRDVMINIG